MELDPDFAHLMEQVRAGDDRAATELVGRYAGPLIALARRRLDGRLCAKLEPEDVLQSVFRSFFLRQADGRLAPRDWDHLWALLVTLTVRKCSGQHDHFRAARRDHRRDAPAGDVDSPFEVAGREPTPDQAAALEDLVEQLLRGFDPHDRRIVMLRLQDYSVPEIQADLGCSERTIQRVLRRAKDKLHGMLEELDAE
jgi:RNA polymerase sigma-70 factor (ECF subfamily)